MFTSSVYYGMVWIASDLLRDSDCVNRNLKFFVLSGEGTSAGG